MMATAATEAPPKVQNLNPAQVQPILEAKPGRTAYLLALLGSAVGVWGNHDQVVAITSQDKTTITPDED